MSETQSLLDPPHKPTRTRKDPLQRLGDRRIAAAKARVLLGDVRQSAGKFALLVFAPTALFVLTLFIVCQWFNYWPFWVLLTISLAMAKSIILQQFFVAQKWQRWLGRSLLTSALAGLVIGLFIYYRHLVFYFHYRDAAGHVHSNVAPSQLADEYADAGMLMFTSDTRVDTSLSVGYRSAWAGATLCVAPVVDSLMKPGDSVYFWAAGVDCCAWRAQFSCGDAGNAGAGGGLLRVEASSLVSPATAWMVDDPSIREGFKAALELAHAVDNIVVGEGARLVLWASDPKKLQDQYFWDAFRWCVIWTVVVLLLNGLASLFVMQEVGDLRLKAPRSTLMM